MQALSRMTSARLGVTTRIDTATHFGSYPAPAGSRNKLVVYTASHVGLVTTMCPLDESRWISSVDLAFVGTPDRTALLELADLGLIA